MTHEELDDLIFDHIINLTKNKKLTWYKDDNKNVIYKNIAYFKGFVIRISDLNIIVEKEESPTNSIVLIKMQNEKKFNEICDLINISSEDRLLDLKKDFLAEVKRSV